MCRRTKSIAGRELLYRRIPATTDWHKKSQDARVHRNAFSPSKDDIKGVSLSRSKYETPEQAAGRGRSGKMYYIAILKASDLRDKDIEVIPTPKPGDPGHAELPELRYEENKTDKTRELQMLLAKLVIDVKGPFAGTMNVPLGT